MRILVVSPFLPFPLDSGGSIRIYNIIHALSQNHELTLLCYVSFGDGRFVKQLESICNVIPVLFSPSGRKPIYHAKHFFSKLPFPLVFKDRHFKKTLAEYASKNFDIVQFEFLPLAHYIDLFPARTKRVLVEHYIAAQARKKLLLLWSAGIKKFYYAAELCKIKRYERDILHKFDLCLVTSKKDQEYLIKWCQPPHVMVSPNGVDINFFSPQPQQSDEKADLTGPTLAYVGSFDLDPANIDGLAFLMEDIWPSIKKEVPNVRLEVMGKGLPENFIANCRDESIHIHGYVEDIRPVLGKADVFVLPLRGGFGTKIRILTAMAMGIPVVATAIASDGIEIQPAKNIFIGNNPASLADQTIRLLKDTAIKREIGFAGRKLVEKKYGWNPIVQALENRYLDLIESSDFKTSDCV